ncbi:MAG TPA: alkaline phosphatase family protein, partial [Gemmatimonadales bacterium]|nr:alkaline phosphatase family protein [Gemmatimonadales bacterium]
DTTIAKVNGSGLVSGVAMGSTSITATSEGKSGAATLTVTNVPVASVAVTPATATITVGQTVQLTATPRDASGNPVTGRVVTWSTSDTTIALVNASGLVTGRVAGTATITATSEGKSGTATITVAASTGGASFDHIFIVMEENNDYLSVTTSSMPYLTGLAAQGGLATRYYADTHPSIGNYLMLSSGQIITNDDNYASTINVDNVVRELVAAGKTWKSYAEGLPSVGFVTLNYDDNTYASRHNPVVYYTDVHDDTTQAKNVVPFTQFATDLASGSLPNYTFIVPNLCNDAHDCSLTTADNWLQTNIDPLIKSTFFQQHNCLLIITFDESASDNTNGGGRVYWLAVGSKVKAGYQSTTLYQHESTLRVMLKGLGVTTFPGAAASAPDMSEFFTP